jgi:glycosyltransferase involved in cell wall biosynthesis
MGTSLTLSLILPCFNEGPIITANVHRIHSVLDRLGYPYEIIFVDDASHDGTQNRIARLCNKYPHCRALYHESNMGRGGTVMDGIARARGIVAGYMDIDCEVSPVYIPEIVDMIITRTADMIIGRRVYRSTVQSLSREVLSVGYRWIASHVMDTRGLDTESGYKFFRKSKILPILPYIHDRHWFWDTEVVVWAIRKHVRVKEYPVLYLRRSDKKSSVRIVHDTIEYLTQIVRFTLGWL